MPRTSRARIPSPLEDLASIREQAIAAAEERCPPEARAVEAIRVDLALLERLLRSFLERVGRRRLAERAERILGLPEGLSAEVPTLADGEVATRFSDWLAAAPWVERGAKALEEAATALAGHHDKRSAGKFYTPPAVIEHIVEHAFARALRRVSLAEIRVLEPSCGAGDFVVAAFDRLVDLRVAAGETAARARRDVLARNVYAVDSDPVAIVVTRMRLLGRLLDGSSDASGELGFPHILQENALWDGLEPPTFGITLELPFDERARAASPHLEGGTGLLAGAGPFHVIVGNPPYGAELDPVAKAWLRKRYQLAEGRVETAAIFLERVTELLAPGGAVGLVMPHALTRSGGYRGARRLLADRLALDTLVDLGDGFPGIQLNTMVFTATSGPAPPRVTLYAGSEGSFRPVSKVPRAFLWERETLSMHVDARDVDFWRRIEALGRPLRALVENERGYNLPSRKQHLRAPGGAEPGLPVVQGRDLERYGRIDPSTLPTVDPRLDGLPAPLDVPALALQNVSNVIEATVLPAGVLPLDTVNLLYPRGDDVDPFFLLAVLDSPIMELYFRDLVINRATLTVHLDEPTLGGLPIILPSPARQRAIGKRVRPLVGAGGETLSARGRLALVAAIDREIDALYQVPAELADRLRRGSGADAADR